MAHGEDQKRANYAVVRETEMPAILTEIGFIDSADAKLLKNDEFLRDMAAAYARGVAEFLGIKANQSVTSKTIKIQTGGLTSVKVMEVSEFFLKEKVVCGNYLYRRGKSQSENWWLN